MFLYVAKVTDLSVAPFSIFTSKKLLMKLKWGRRRRQRTTFGNCIAFVIPSIPTILDWLQIRRVFPLNHKYKTSVVSYKYLFQSIFFEPVQMIRSLLQLCIRNKAPSFMNNICSFFFRSFQSSQRLWYPEAWKQPRYSRNSLCAAASRDTLISLFSAGMFLSI